jgi:citrate lyase subunit beta / citryl-CoA lyase
VFDAKTVSMQEPSVRPLREQVGSIRSLLYVPASSERFLARAHERGADAIVLDLEDAVAPERKDDARARLATAVKAVGERGAVVFVRINSEPGRIRLDAEAACRAGAFGLFVAKSREARALAALEAFLDRIERDIGRTATCFVPMIEDPGAVLDARSIAAASGRVFALATGGEDLATALGAEPTPEVLRVPKLMVHLAAKAAGVRSFGLMRTVADYNDLAGIETAAREARMFGFDGATCVHPAVVPILNRAFSPSAAEIDRARALIAAFEAANTKGLGAFEFEGRMVDEPVVQRARALLARASAAKA